MLHMGAMITGLCGVIYIAQPDFIFQIRHPPPSVLLPIAGAGRCFPSQDVDDAENAWQHSELLHNVLKQAGFR